MRYQEVVTAAEAVNRADEHLSHIDDTVPEHMRPLAYADLLEFLEPHHRCPPTRITVFFAIRRFYLPELRDVHG